MPEDPDDWYQERADNLAGWEGRLLSSIDHLLLRADDVVEQAEKTARAKEPLGRYSSTFPREIRDRLRKVWRQALAYDNKPEDSLVVIFSPENPYRRRFDDLVRIAQILGVRGYDPREDD